MDSENTRNTEHNPETTANPAAGSPGNSAGNSAEGPGAEHSKSRRRGRHSESRRSHRKADHKADHNADSKAGHKSEAKKESHQENRYRRAAKKAGLGGAARASKVFRNQAGAARWVAFAEMLLSSVEEAVWELRQVYDEIVDEAVRSWTEAKSTTSDLNVRRRDLEAELVRLLSIARTVSTVILSYRFTSIGGAFMSRAGYERRLENLHKKNASRIVHMAEKLQGGMIKVGQMLSARMDLLPKIVTDELAKLQDRVTPLDPETIRLQLEAAWGKERLATVVLDPTPIGAASIAQVHRAILPDGREVAVKVKRPGIDVILRHDMANLRRVLNSLSAYLPDFEIGSVMDEIETQVMKEVDFIAEAQSIDRAVSLMKNLPGVVVPPVIDGWSDNDVLVTEFHKGARIDLALDERAARGDRHQNDAVLSKLLEIYARQILEWGFFQPDTHPGNFLVKEDGTLVLLDFGCAREISHEFRRNLAKVMGAFLGGRDDEAAQVIQDLGFRTRSGDTKPLVLVARQLLTSLMAGGTDIWNTDEMKSKLEDAAFRLLEDPVVKVPVEAVMVGRALMTIGGVFYSHQPKIDPVKTLLPVIARAMMVKN